MKRESRRFSGWECQYLRVYPVWEQVPGKNISYGDETLYHLHLRTR
jgi:hypothetical protein